MGGIMSAQPMTATPRGSETVSDAYNPPTNNRQPATRPVG